MHSRVDGDLLTRDAPGKLFIDRSGSPSCKAIKSTVVTTAAGLRTSDEPMFIAISLPNHAFIRRFTNGTGWT